MARDLPNRRFRIPNRHDSALHSVGRNATRRYLQTQLRELDAQIEALTYAQMQDSWRMLERAAWTQPAAAEIVWTGRLELHYLYAVREALLETLARW